MTGKREDGKVFQRIEEIKQIKADKESGRIFCIPFESYPKLAASVPGIVPGMITMITAGSGVGKTQVTKALAVREPLEYARRNNIKLKIFYFALEESKQEFIDTMICNYVSSKGIKLDLLTLQGFRVNALAESSMKAIETHLDDIEELLDSVEIIDSVYNATGIYKYCRDYADKNGKHVYEDRAFIKKKNNGTTETETVKVYSHYEANDPHAITIVVVDHLSLLVPEKDKVTGNMMSQHQTMAKWSTDYALKQLTKHWNWAVVNVIQQEQSGEKEQFTNKGDSIVKKTEPALSNFANNKEIQRDAKIVLGVYSPDRYGFEDYHDYDIKRFRDSFRAIKVLKNRFGPPNKYIHMLFDGASNRFDELPLPNESQKLIKFYEAADRLLGRTGAPVKKLGISTGFGS